MNAAELAERLSGRKSGSGWMARCPAHDDHDPSLSISDGDGGHVLVHCHAGCTQDAVVGALRDRGLWPSEKKGEISPKKGRYGVTGVTLKQLAEAKHLPVGFLEQLRLATATLKGVPAVKIPYCDITGTVVAMRTRLSLEKTGQRFAWRKGDHTTLYGLERLDEVRKAGWCLLVEGESDCWTCWFHGLPALGIPGKSTWKKEWAEYLVGLEVYLWQEPDAADLVGKVGAAVKGLKVIQAPDSTKDISEAHVRGEDVPTLLNGLRTTATEFESIQREESSTRLADLERQATPIFAAPDPLVLVEAAIRQLGYGGDIKTPLIAYLSATSRLLALRPGTTPVHILLIGAPSAGKSWTVRVVLRLLPDDAYHVIDAGSSRVLIYDDADLRHRVLVFGEADSLPTSEDNPAASALRNLLQDNKLHYKVVMRDEKTGEFAVRTIEKAGPTTLITTAVKPLGEQLMSRLFTLEVAENRGQVKAALRAQANIEFSGTVEPDGALVAYQGYLQLRAPWNVFVPFVTELAVAVGEGASAPRILRDFQRLISLVKAVTVLRHRQRHIDSTGRLIAELADYEYVRNLVGQMYSDTVTGATEGVRMAVEAVGRLGKAMQPGSKVTVTAVGAALGISKMTASRHVKAAVNAGYLVNDEIRRRHPADLHVGEPLPDRIGLPDPKRLVLKDCNSVTPEMGGYTPLFLAESLHEVVI